MKFLSLTHSWNDTQTAFRYSLYTNIFLAITVAFLAVAVANKKPVVIPMPPQVTHGMQISANSASAGFLKPWGHFLASTLGNVTPATAGFIEQNLDELFDPTIYRRIRAEVEDQALTIKQDRIAQSFIARNIEYEEKTGKIFVSGKASRSVLDGEPTYYEKTFEFKINIENYRPWIVWFDTYKGEPRTEKYLSNRGE